MFRKILIFSRRHHHMIRNQIIDKIRPRGPWVTQILNLHRCWTKCKNPQPIVLHIPHEIDQNVHPIIVNAPRGVEITQMPDVDESIRILVDTFSVGTAVVFTIRVGVNRKLAPVMQPEQLKHQVRSSRISEAF